jgi:outer membrane protein
MFLLISSLESNALKRAKPSSMVRAVILLAVPMVLASIAAAKQANGSPSVPAPQIVMPELPSPVPAGEQLTLGQAIQIGLRDNPQIAASHYSVESARQNYNSQKSPINPSLSYAALNNTVAPLDYGNGFALGSNYSAYATIETNGAIRYRTGQAREQFHQAQFDAATTGLSLKLAIVDAYTALQVANRGLEVELKVYDNISKLSDLTDKRFATGAGPQSDATRARIAAIQEQQNVIADAANVNAARASLNAELGRPQNSPIDVAEPLTYSPTPIDDLEELIKIGERDRPELLSANANLRALQSVVGLERSAYFPNVEVAKDFGNDGQIFVGMSIPLDLGGIHGAVAKARADVKVQLAQIEIERQGIDLDVRSAYINLVSAEKQVNSYETGILKLSETLVDQVRQGYALGANTIVDIITAESTYRSVESAYYTAIGTYVQAAYELKHSIGDLPGPTPGSPCTPPSPPPN